MSKKFSYDNYDMYVEEVEKNGKLMLDIKYLKLQIYNLESELKKALNNIDKEVEKAIKPLIEKIRDLEEQLIKSNNEIERLKKQINSKDDKKDYLIDKLNNQVNKNSTNSSIPTSKEINSKNQNRTNQYNLRESSSRSSGGQAKHKGSTLTKTQIENKIVENNLEVRVIEHYINSSLYNKTTVKYKVGIEVKPYVEKHVFIPSKESREKLSREFYSDVTYKSDLKSIIILLGNYCSLPYNKIKELISDLTNDIVNLSEGTIDNIYEEFSNKVEDTLSNITNNLLNGTYQHTDETVTKENGKDSYYRGYANKENVLYKYHSHKGDTPIKDDGILEKFFGTLITDHDTGMFKYGTNNQDCIVHFGRYCIEQKQNIFITTWQMEIYRLLLKFERNRKILIKYNKNSFNEDEIKFMEEEYDSILELAKVENELIPSTYWKEKAITLMNRCIKYKNQMLFYIHNFTIDYDNNFMERALRMIKNKTKVSGGFRSHNGGTRFGNIMSVIKTSKLRGINPFDSINEIINGKSLFA